MGELAVRLAELVEAEGRAARIAVMRLGVALGMMVVTAVVGAAGVGLLAAAGVVALADVIGLPLALLSVGGGLVILAFVLLGIAQTLTRKKVT